MNEYDVLTLKMIADEGGLEAVYGRGYNDAKREIALSGEYERAYNRGKDDALKALERLESEYKAYHTDNNYWRGVWHALAMIGGVDQDG